MKKHEMFCNYSITQCVLKLDNCRWCGMKNKRMEHSLQHHPKNTAMSSKQTFLWTEPESNSSCRILMMAFGKQFECLWEFVDYEEIHFSVTYLDDPKAASRYYYTITFQSEENPEDYGFFKRRCHPRAKCSWNHDELHIHTDLNKIFDGYNFEENFYYTVSLYKYNFVSCVLNFEVVIMEASPELCEIFTCPICLNIMTTLVFMCELGHSFCGRCFYYTDKCPTCRHNTGALRNLPIERLQIKFVFKCSNEADGCKFYSSTIELREHEAFCEYSLIKCDLKLDNCTWSGPRNEIINHSLQYHTTNVAAGSKQTFLWTTPDNDSNCRIRMKAFDKHFLCFWNFKNVSNNNLFVMHLGPIRYTNNLYYTVIIQNRENPRSIFVFKRRCHPISRCKNVREDVHIFLNLNNILDDCKCETFYYTISLYNYNVSIKDIGNVKQPSLSVLKSNAICPKWMNK
ncbi:hypothetical protein FQA39_LY07123 [Lamprigera yunnana]|nr:hypothetical protein FQA39_LY07123 [Lamprigera yunnana]